MCQQQFSIIAKMGKYVFYCKIKIPKQHIDTIDRNKRVGSQKYTKLTSHQMIYPVANQM